MTLFQQHRMWTQHDIAGYSLISPEEQEFLLKHIAPSARRVIEVGSYCGATAASILDSRPDLHIVAIEPFLSADWWFAALMFLQNQKSHPTLNAWVGTFAQWLATCGAGQRADLVIVDGSHHREPCAADLATAANLTDMIAVHDYGVHSLPGVQQAVDEMPGWIIADRCKTTVILKRAGETAVEWSLRTWRERHDRGYFPNSKQHHDWHVYPKLYDWFERLAAPQPTDVCLEIGAGFGQWMIPLSRLVSHVAGCDIHPVPIDKGRELFAEHGCKNCRLDLSDGMTLPYADDSFSLVYSISCFQHLPREIVRGYLTETRRVLAQDGRTVHQFRNADDVGDHPPPATEITAYHTGDFSCGWTRAQVQEAGEAAGLECEVHKVPLRLILIGRNA